MNTPILQTLKEVLAVLSDEKYVSRYTQVTESISKLTSLIDQIEKMEPVAIVSNEHRVDINGEHVLVKTVTFDSQLPPATKLYTSPPDAQAEIDRLTKERDGLEAEVARLKKELYISEGRTQLRHKATLALDDKITELRQQLAELEGWQLVPKNPTKEMSRAGADAIPTIPVDAHNAAYLAYKAMLAAAPKQEK